MHIKYRKLRESTFGETNMVVRFFTDLVTESHTCLERDAGDIIIKCRTDYLVNVPLVPMTEQELEAHIWGHCPVQFFYDEEARILAESGTVHEDLSNAHTLMGNITPTVKTKEFKPVPTTNAEWVSLKRKAISDKRDALILSGGFPLRTGGSTYWFHSNSISTCQQLGLISAGIIAKMQGAPDTTVLHPVPWKTMGGATLVLTVGVAMALLSSSFAQQGLLFAASEAHLTALAASGNPKAYDAGVNWPVTYQTSGL